MKKTEQGFLILHEDESCLVTDQYIKINKYFFPLGAPRTIMYKDVDKISLESADDVSTLWGLSSHHLNNWFPLDQERKGKKLFIAIHEKGNRIIPSLTPDDAVGVFDVIRARFLQMGSTHPVLQANHEKQKKVQDNEDPHKITEMKKQDQIQQAEVKN